MPVLKAKPIIRATAAFPDLDAAMVGGLSLGFSAGRCEVIRTLLEAANENRELQLKTISDLINMYSSAQGLTPKNYLARCDKVLNAYSRARVDFTPE